MSSKKQLEVVAALIRKDNTILLCQRRENDAFPLFWEFPGGTVEAGEEQLSALQREIKEEINLDIEMARFVEKFEDENDSLRIEVYLYEVLNFRGKIQCLECKDYGFFNAAEIENINLAPVDKKIFNYLKKHSLSL